VRQQLLRAVGDAATPGRPAMFYRKWTVSPADYSPAWFNFHRDPNARQIPPMATNATTAEQNRFKIPADISSRNLTMGVRPFRLVCANINYHVFPRGYLHHKVRQSDACKSHAASSPDCGSKGAPQSRRVDLIGDITSPRPTPPTRERMLAAVRESYTRAGLWISLDSARDIGLPRSCVISPIEPPSQIFAELAAPQTAQWC